MTQNFKRNGAYKLLSKSKLFNKEWYLKQYPDVADAKMDSIHHYLTFGWKEGRNPGPEFDGASYLRENQDVLAAMVCPLVHYLQYGINEGRKIRPVQPKTEHIDLSGCLDKARKQIQDSKITCVSFDIFDTLLVRPVIEPRDIFHLIAARVDKKYHVDFVAMRHNAEAEMKNPNASIADIYTYIRQKYNLTADVANALMAEEINCESQLLFPRQDGRRLYDLALSQNKKVIAISDMYLPSDVLKNILHAKGFDKIEQVYVSNEYFARKSNGKLFRAVMGELNIAPQNVLHIGDNRESDFVKPSEFGMVAAYVPSVMDCVLSRSMYARVFNRLVSDDPMTRILMGFAINFTYGDSEQNPLSKARIFENHRSLAYMYLSPMLYYIASSMLLDKKMQKKYKKMFFASRDGYMPNRVYDALRPIFGGIESEYVYAGRRAYYMARGVEFFDYLETLATAGSTRYTLANIIDCYILDAKLHDKIIKSLSAEELDLVFNNNKSECIEILSRFKKDITKHINELKKNTIKYYTSLACKGRNIIFDLGYGGSVSDALTQITKTPFDKVYVWQDNKNIAMDEKNKTTTKVLFDGTFNYPLEHIILEEIFSPLSGACIGFDSAGTPMFESQDFSPEMVSDMNTIHDSCMNFIENIKTVFGPYLKHLQISDANAIRKAPEYAFWYSSESEEELFQNVVFSDNIFYSKPLSLCQKLQNNNGKNGDKPKLLLVSNEMSYSGAPHSLLRMCKVLKDNYHLTVWTLKAGNFEREFNKFGIEVVHIPESEFSNPSVVARVRQFDLAICNTILTDVALRSIQRHVHCLWYIREAENIPSFMNKNRLALLEHSYNTEIFCVSEYAKDYIDRTFNTTVRVCHNCVEDLNDGYKKRFNIGRRLNIAVLGNFEPRKGFMTVIDAVKKLPESMQNKIHLSLVGRSFQGEYSKSILNAIDGCDNISYLGEIDNIDDKVDLYKRTDVVIVPSTDESCSLVALEGIMMGCPIIVTKNVGAKYVVDNNTGWIFDTGNSDQLSGILADIISGKHDIKKMGSYARQKYLDTSNMTIYRQNILRMVENVLAYKSQKKMLVHLHLYYHDQLDYMLTKLSNISGCEWDLCVTTTQITDETSKKILALKPDAQIIQVENAGYDVWPFINVIQNTDLSQYDYVLKIHTKAYQNQPNALGKVGFWWRDEVIDVLLRDKNQFAKNMDVFRHESDIGMICSKLMLRSVSGNPAIAEESNLFDDEIARLKFKTDNREYCAGTMFMARASVFDFIKTANLTIDMFRGSQETHGSGTLAHVYERILGVATAESGMRIYPQISDHQYDDEVIPIIFAADNNYMPCTSVAICSLFENKKPSTKYDVYVLCPSGINKKYIRLIVKMAARHNSTVNFVNMRDQFSAFRSQIEHISIVTYYRLLLPSLLPQYKKCIWIDGDTIVCRDLSEMFHTDMSNAYIAGVLAPYAGKDPAYAGVLHIGDMRQYVNAGVLVWNLALMRADNLESRFLRLMNVDFKMMDQDILNVACYGHIKLLPFKYNVMNKVAVPEERRQAVATKLYSEYELQNGFANPVILHYCDAKKPWSHSNIAFYDLWRKYADITGLFPHRRFWSNMAKIATKIRKFVLSATRDGATLKIRIFGIRIKKTNKYRSLMGTLHHYGARIDKSTHCVDRLLAENREQKQTIDMLTSQLNSIYGLLNDMNTPVKKTVAPKSKVAKSPRASVKQVRKTQTRRK